MQNQYSNGNHEMNNQTGNQLNDPVQRGNGKKSGPLTSTKYYVLGMVTGILAALAVVLGVLGVVRFYRAVLPLGREDTSLEAKSGGTASITDASVEKKLAVLEDTIAKYFWKDVEEETLEDGLYRGLLDSLEDPYSVYYTNE